MKASFAILAATGLLLLGVTFALGLGVSGSAVESAARGALYERHFLLGLAAMLYVCFVHVIAFTYLVVFSRMAQDAVRTAGMGSEGLVAVSELKRRMVRWLLAGVATVLVTGATGSMRQGPWAIAATWHLSLAVATWLVNAIAFVREYQLIHENVALTEALYARLPPATPGEPLASGSQAPSSRSRNG